MTPSTALDLLEVPASASFVAASAEPAAAMNWTALIEAADRLAAHVPIAAARQAVGVRAENGIDAIVTILAIIRAGGVPAPFAPAVAAPVAAACLERLGATAEWTTSDGWRRLPGTGVMPEGFELVMHTSGSTGLPKPIAIRLAAMRDNARDVAAALGLGAGDVHLGTMSYCYMSGLYNATVLPAVTGARTVFGTITGPATLEGFVAAIQRHRPTVIWANPLVAGMLIRLRGVPDSLFQGVRYVISCTAPLPLATKTAFEARFGVPLLQSYGLSETLITTVEDPAAPGPGTSGKPVGQKGAVRIRSDGVVVIANSGMCAGYLFPFPEAKRVEALMSFETEDLGEFDAGGNLVITGRTSETIHRHGIKLSPERIERAILEDQKIAECAVVNFARDDRNLVVAWVAGRDATPDSVFAHLRARLEPQERPDIIEFINDFPRTQSGKIDRKTLTGREPNAVHRP